MYTCTNISLIWSFIETVGVVVTGDIVPIVQEEHWRCIEVIDKARETITSLAKREDGEVYSFCMCPGGEILPSSERDGYLCVNGASRYQRRSPWANSGFVVTLEPEHFGAGEDPLAGILLQEQIEKAAYDSAGGDFAVPALRLSDFLSGEISEDLPECSYPRPLIATDFAKFLPEFIISVNANSCMGNAMWSLFRAHCFIS